VPLREGWGKKKRGKERPSPSAVTKGKGENASRWKGKKEKKKEKKNLCSSVIEVLKKKKEKKKKGGGEGYLLYHLLRERKRGDVDQTRGGEKEKGKNRPLNFSRTRSEGGEGGKG